MSTPTAIKPIGRRQDEYKIQRKPMPCDNGVRYTLEELKSMNSSDRNLYLRNFNAAKGERWSWELVNYFAWDQELQERKKQGTPELDGPGGKIVGYFSNGYEELPPLDKEFLAWIWVEDMACLSGRGGWLEVNMTTRRQGRFQMICIS